MYGSTKKWGPVHTWTPTLPESGGQDPHRIAATGRQIVNSKWLVTETQLLSVQITLTPGLYPGPGINMGPGFYRTFYRITCIIILRSQTAALFYH